MVLVSVHVRRELGFRLLTRNLQGGRGAGIIGAAAADGGVAVSRGRDAAVGLRPRWLPRMGRGREGLVRRTVGYGREGLGLDDYRMMWSEPVGAVSASACVRDPARGATRRYAD